MVNKKYTILVVDDEMPSCKKIKLLLDKLNTPFKIIDFASNGREGLKKYQQHEPDLIIVDIHMAVMDGLEFIKTIRKKDNNQKFIILSCHENFHYAREAIKMEVKDYLIKHLLTKEDLFTLLKKVEEELNIQYNKYHFPIQDRDMLLEQKNIIMKKIVFQLENEEVVNQYIHKYKLNLIGSNYVVFSCIIDEFNQFIEDLSYKEIDGKMKKILALIYRAVNEDYKGETLYKGNGEFIIIAILNNSKSQMEYIVDSTKLINNIRYIINQYIKISLTIGVSRMFSMLSKITDSYNHAYNTTKYRIYTGKGKNLFSHAVMMKLNNLDPIKVDDSINKIEICLREDKLNTALNYIHELYSKELSGFLQYNYLKHINTHLLTTLIILCKENSVSYRQVFNSDFIPIEDVEALETIKEIEQWFAGNFTKILAIKKRNSNYSKKVIDAIQYIEQNNNTNLQELSEIVNISKSYLCRLFKQETGKNITHYILENRMKKAKTLIDSSNYKIYEIAEILGYPYPQQLTVDFKKITGISPIEYREKSAVEMKYTAKI